MNTDQNGYLHLQAGLRETLNTHFLASLHHIMVW